MTIRILINGASGKMGQFTVKTIQSDAQFNLVGQLNHTHDLSAEIKKTQPQVVVDFTNANVALKNVETIIDAGVHPVIGTSGLTKDHVKKLEERCEKLKLGGIIAPNFSLGAVLMMKQAQEIAKYFPHIEIIEMHHDRKLDSPSGTAMRTAELLATYANSHSTQSTNETVKGARGAQYQNIPIHAIRLPGLVAHQQIIFGGQGETLTIRHDSIDRECFMPGVVLACKKVMELNRLVYGLEHVLF